MGPGKYRLRLALAPPSDNPQSISAAMSTRRRASGPGSGRSRSNSSSSTRDRQEGRLLIGTALAQPRHAKTAPEPDAGFEPVRRTTRGRSHAHAAGRPDHCAAACPGGRRGGARLPHRIQGRGHQQGAARRSGKPSSEDRASQCRRQSGGVREPGAPQGDGAAPERLDLAGDPHARARRVPVLRLSSCGWCSGCVDTAAASSADSRRCSIAAPADRAGGACFCWRWSRSHAKAARPRCFSTGCSRASTRRLPMAGAVTLGAASSALLFWVMW